MSNIDKLILKMKRQPNGIRFQELAKVLEFYGYTLKTKTGTSHRQFINQDGNVITIKAGIDRKNYNKTIEVITKVLDQVQKGKFTTKDIQTAKKIYENSISSIEEDPLQIINEYLTEEIIKFENYKERVSIMNKVTKREIIKVLKKIKIDTIFLLEGEE